MAHRSIITITVLLLCQAVAFAQTGKMSPYLRRMSMEYAQCARRQTLSDRAVYTTALVRTTDTDVLRANGCRILASWGDIHAVSIPVSSLGTLVSIPQIQRIEANEPCSLTNDTTASITGVFSSPLMSQRSDDVRNTYGLTGKGVIVGIEDVGFDLTNPNYFTQDGSRYRVKAVWDQLDWSASGEPVKFKVSEDSVYIAPGRQYTDEASILQKGATADSLYVFHGCHTSGTAAGSGLGGVFKKPLRWEFQYAGMAPEADLCIVNNIVNDNYEVIPKEHLAEYTSATDLLGFKYIFDYADKVGKPCVINFSEGSHQNLQNNQLYNEVLQKMVGSGRIICVSAGNEGRKGSYMHKQVGEEGNGAFLTSASSYAYYTFNSTAPVNFTITFYRSASEKQKFTFDTTDLSQHTDSIWSDTLQTFDSRYAVALQIYKNCFDKEKYATELLVTDLQGEDFSSSDIKLSLTLNGLDNDIEVYESGGYFVKNNYDASLSDFTKDHNILFPGSSPAVITSGYTAYVTPRENLLGNLVGVNFGVDGALVDYSSKGPTMSGLLKPDVVAPGTNVISGHSSFYNNDFTEEDTWLMNFSEWNGRRYPWQLNSGTSMASPVVAGIIALWLEACPTLDADEIREVFANTCRHRDVSLSYPNNYWGWGEIDAVAGLEYIRTHYTGIDDVNAETYELRSLGTQEYDLMGRRVADSSTYRGIVIKADGSKVVR